MTRPIQEQYLKTGEVAEMLGVHGKTVSRWAAEGRLPSVKTIGGHHRYPRSLIEALRDQLTTHPDQEVR